MRQLITPIALILIGVQTIFAQFTKSIEISSYFDDNLYRSPYPVSDMFSTLDINLEYQFGDTPLSIAYQGGFYLYQETRDRNFSLHGINLSYFDYFGQEEENTYTLGLSGSLRSDNEMYNYYDYQQLFFYVNTRIDLWFSFLKAGYNFRSRKYINLSYLSNIRHYGFIQINKSFDTRTTIILEADIGQKSFQGQEIFTTQNSLTGGKGQGQMNTGSGTTSVTTYVPSLSHLILLGRLTQSLHDKVGVYLQYRRQINLGGSSALINSEGFYQDEELFDDPFSFESEGISSQLTWIMPWSMQIKVGGSLFSKNYISENAFFAPEDTVAMGGLRTDDQNYYYINFSKSIYFNESWLNVLRINLYYNYINNSSNSYWYNYKNLIFGGGIQWAF
jgi:hypothetical protein